MRTVPAASTPARRRPPSWESSRRRWRRTTTATNGLPAVNIYEVWNEPNLSLDLAPAKASIYRAMVNAVADGVHSVDPANLVVAGDLDPFGHPKSKKQKWYSVAPLAFMRSLLCLSKGSHPHSTCSAKVHFDVWSHHPYTFGGAFGKATQLRQRRARRPAEDAVAAAGRRAASPRRLVPLHAVLGHGVRLGHEPAAPRARPRSRSPLAGPPSLCTRRGASESRSSPGSTCEDHSGTGPYKSGLYFHASSLSQRAAEAGADGLPLPVRRLPAR